MTAVPLLSLLSSLVASSPASRCEQIVLHREKPLMSTYVGITARGCDAGELEGAIRAAFAEMERLSAQLSEWEPHSAVSQVSARAGVAPVVVPPALFTVLDVSQQVAALTGGAFDVTWAALADLWHFPATQDSAPAPRLPAPAAVARQLALVGYQNLDLDRGASTAYLRHPGMRLGLGGVAKGYIAAAAADLLVSRGVADVLVAASGDLAARGTNGPRPWTAAIEDPRRTGVVLATVELRDESLSTAGDYEHCFFVAGHRYHHILDPKTGYPAEGAESVTVLSTSGALADALDTGLLVLGTAHGTAAVAGLDVGALFVSAAGVVHAAGARAGRFALAPALASPRADTRQ